MTTPAPPPGRVQSSALWTRLYAIGWALDVLLAAVLLGAHLGETMSHCAARRAAERAGWACLLCAALSRVVEPDHCARTSAGDVTSHTAAARAGLALAGLVAALLVALHLLLLIL